MFITENTLDDLLRQVFTILLAKRTRIRPGRGKASELCGVMLELANPRARLSWSESRGRFSSCLGELAWYLAGANDLKFISYYLPRYVEESEDGKTVYGAYGPRLFAGKRNQVDTVLQILRTKRDSRRAVIQLFDAADIAKNHREVPCTCTLQFMLRQQELHLLVNMRSNDAYIGLPHDVFAFTMLQEIFARSLGARMGVYKHAVGSLHLYDKDRQKARWYLKEGWQATAAMPRMPTGDPWSAIRKVLRAERNIRLGRHLNVASLHLPSYWSDFVRLFLMYRKFKDKKEEDIVLIKADMSSDLFDGYADDLRHKRSLAHNSI